MCLTTLRRNTLNLMDMNVLLVDITVKHYSHTKAMLSETTNKYPVLKERI